MKMYAWQPKGHGELSFFVMANSQEEAVAAVERHIQVRYAKAQLDWLDDNHEPFSDIYHRGWGTDYYELTVAEVGQVVENNND